MPLRSLILAPLVALSLTFLACGSGDDDGDSQTNDCPASEPAGAGCGSAGLFCEYPGRQCICGTDGAWLCDDVDPSCLAEPSHGVACPAEDVVCAYRTGQLCLCKDGAWNCP